MRQKLFIIFILWANAGILTAQPKRIRFDVIGINQGLSQSYVNDITQDSLGFIWIATQDGLNKFDGYRFKVFKKDPEKSSSLNNNYINCILSGKNNTLWLGTNGGGLSTFNTLTEQATHIALHASLRFINDLAFTDDDNLWIATSGGGLAKYTLSSKKITNYGVSKGVTATTFNCLYVSAEGKLYAGSAGKGLFEYDAREDIFKKINNPLIDEVVWSISESKEGILWLATNNGLCKIKKDQERYIAVNYHTTYNVRGLSNNTIKSVYVSSDNLLYVGTTGGGLNISSLNHKNLNFYTYRHNDFDPFSLSDDIIQNIFEDKSGCIWIATQSGISKFDPVKQGFDHINFNPLNSNSLNDKNVWAIVQDKNGILYVGTREGVTRVDRKNNLYNRYNRIAHNKNSLNNNSLLSLFIDNENIIWVGAMDGLFKLKPAEDFTTAYYEPVVFRKNNNNFNDNRVYKIIQDTQGYIWVGSKEGLSRIDKQKNKFIFFQHDEDNPESLPSNVVRTLYVDKSGNLWAGCDGAGLVLIDYSQKDKIAFKSYAEVISSGSGQENIIITSIWEDNAGNLWLGTYGSGLIQFNTTTQKVRIYTEKDGLPNNSVYGVLGDDKNNLWMSTNLGLSRFNLSSQQFNNYLERDGIQSNEFNVGAYFKNNQGELFFGGINGLNAFYPQDIIINTKPPQVVITDIKLFGKHINYSDDKVTTHVSVSPKLKLGYRENSITIEFAALHYSNAANNTYKYMMEGLDESYIMAANTREASYNRIPYGNYVFKVFGANSDGVWSVAPAQIEIIISPPFWHTWWFRSIGIFFLCLLVFGIYQIRLYNIKSHRLKLAKEVRERTQEVMLQKEEIEKQKKIIEEEKNKVEKLLLNILPEETAEELKLRGKASARSYRQVTIMFTDFVSFTKIAESMRPADLVAQLDSYFIKFDEIIQKHNLEKIKTIGDAYMCAGGVPIRSKSNPIDTVLAALEIQHYMRELKQNYPNDKHWDLRIGINTGEIIAGVIGTKRFAYDIWGNSVNVAQRMETSAEPGKINISGNTFELVEPYFEFTYRGKIAAKNKGEVDMYYVERIKPELSVNGEGLIPNEKFWKYVDLYLYSSINYKKAERHIMKILQERLPDNLYYHGIHHTYDVIEAAERLALMEGITDEQMFILKSAATYHDAGFVEQYAKNEPIGIRMAQEIMPKYGYTPEQVEQVAELIYATIIPHNPKTHLQQIICDADLDYLGRDDFHAISETLRMELTERGIVSSKRQWDEMQVKFFNMHKYFTQSAIKLRQEKKMKHLKEIEERLKGKYDDE